MEIHDRLRAERAYHIKEEDSFMHNYFFFMYRVPLGRGHYSSPQLSVLLQFFCYIAKTLYRHPFAKARQVCYTLFSSIPLILNLSSVCQIFQGRLPHYVSHICFWL